MIEGRGTMKLSLRQKGYRKRLFLHKAYRMFICFIFMLTLQGCSEKSLYQNGDYYGESEGYYSNIKVMVTISGGKIFEIDIVEHNEPEILADIVFEKLPPIIIKKNSTDVDIISGASYTSKSLIEAVENALTEARK